jgi:hypothetical protein
MELIEYKNYFVTYQRQGNDVNGNPIYLVNVFERYGNYWQNANFVKFKATNKLDKYGNIRIKSYNIIDDIKFMLDKVINM